MEKKGTLTELLSKSLEEAKHAEKGPNTRELGDLFSAVARNILGGSKFEWNDHNWALWMSLANGKEVNCAHIVDLEVERPEGVLCASCIKIGGPESSCAPWWVGTTEDVDRAEFLACLGAKYDLDQKNRKILTAQEAEKAVKEARDGLGKLTTDEVIAILPDEKD